MSSPTSDPESKPKRKTSTTRTVVKNTFSNWTYYLINIGIVVFLTPYLVRELGDERYGVYTIARQAILYIGLLTLGMRSAVNRFISKHIVSNNTDDLNITLSTIAAIYAVIGIVGLFLCGGLGFLSPSFFALRPEYADGTIVLFASMGFMFLLNMWGLTYKSLLIGHQRYDLLNGGEISRELARAGIIVLLLSLGYKNLGGLGVALAAACVIGQIILRFTARWVQPGLRVNPLKGSLAVAKQVVGFSMWNGVIQIGNVVTFASPALVVAKTLGADQVVFFSIPFLLADRIRVFVVGMANTLSPIAAEALATGNRAQFRSLIIQGCRAAAVMCLPVGAVMFVFCRPFLSLWMGEDYAWSWVIYAIMMTAMFGRISQAPTLHVLVGGGRIIGLAKIQAASTIATLVGSIVLPTFTSLGVAGVAIGVAIPLFLSHSIGLPWYATKQIDLPLMEFYRRIYAGPLLSTLPGVAAALLLRWLWYPSTWAAFIAEFAVAMGVCAAFIWRFCLDTSMRNRVTAKLRRAG